MPHKSPRENSASSAASAAGIDHSFRRLVGYETAIWREGYCEIRLAIGPQHMNRLGKVHGGIYATILDAAMGHASTWCPVPGHTRKAVTVSLTTSFLAGVDRGVLTATGHLQSVAGRLVTVIGEVRSDSGVLCALGQASFMYLAGSESLDGVRKTSV